MNEITDDRITILSAAVENMVIDLSSGDESALEILSRSVGRELTFKQAEKLLESADVHTQDQCEDGDCEDHKLTIHYRHQCRPDHLETWDDTWNCACDASCPGCGTKNIEAESWHDFDRASDCVDCE